MDKFVKWVLVNVTLFIACLINGCILMLIMNAVFDLTIGYWAWFGVAFAATEVVSTGVALQKLNL